MRGWPKAVERDRGPGVVGGAGHGERGLRPGSRAATPRRAVVAADERSTPIGSTSRAPDLPDMVRRARSAVAAVCGRRRPPVLGCTRPLRAHLRSPSGRGRSVGHQPSGRSDADRSGCRRACPPEPPGTRRRPGARTGRRPWGLARSGGCGRRRVASDRLRVCGWYESSTVSQATATPAVYGAEAAALLLVCLAPGARASQPRRELCRYRRFGNTLARGPPLGSQRLSCSASAPPS